MLKYLSSHRGCFQKSCLVSELGQFRGVSACFSLSAESSSSISLVPLLYWYSSCL
ncbi:uncharacterized protein CANTADRAFT_26296 [Suhomyces tanzawaensis NRRL Y-17324]|uniref:Uncharacterized protein n=1 Tax=Suhomyces tanzawaensis NRRL Y-17324 TaxID=984487 RepID=A0A1E4SIL1_9ASCO|nr:uncharacterized protein CANTADRAFT_26296 [Suhomyces tanzawaensis NRRL Y-17324]ODV79341.1 hypothetical protein CANTADRAFT_26296 [Suhomyces tanzawaensis NRRL Y-17324]